MGIDVGGNKVSFSFLSGNKTTLKNLALAIAVSVSFLFLLCYMVFGVWFHQPIYDILSGIADSLDILNNIVGGTWNFLTLDWDGDGQHGEFWKELFS